MENQFFINAGIPPPAPPLPFGQSLSSPMVAWPSLSSAMEIQQPTELNCSSDQSQDCFLNSHWENSTDYSLQFESALSSMVSSPAASNSNNISSESFMIRELIGKLGSIGNSGEISPHYQPLLASYINGNNSTNTSCYSTPLNSPPKLSLPIMDGLVKEKLPSLGKSMGLNSSVAEFSADPGFAERAAKFSCFGSKSFNGRTSQFGLNNNNNNNEIAAAYRSNPMAANGKLNRVSSSPSLKAMGSKVGAVQGSHNNNSNSPLQKRSEFANSQEDSSLSEQNPNGDFEASKDSNPRKRKAVPKRKSKDTSPSASPNAAKGSEANEESNEKRCKSAESNGNESRSVKTEEEAKGSNRNAGDERQNKTNKNNNNTKPPEPPKDYIHVRARRGQATDSHSLAERLRREKISERMKLLQNLVPGCNKVTGKALMLDEIINYVQSLQRQVEFLSMKLASVNTGLDFNVDSLMSKDIFQSNNNLPHPIFPIDSSATAFMGQQRHQPQQNPALHSNISNGTMTQCSLDPLDSATATICPSLNTHLPPVHQFHETVPQFPALYEGDLQSIVQMGFGQNSGQEMAQQSPNFHGSNQVSHMKVEL